MNFKQKTYEELLDIEEELHETENEYVYSQLVAVYKEMHKRLRLEGRDKNDWELQDIEKRLVKTLVRYGTYLKTIYRKNDNLARTSLKQALMYDKHNPIANYRLGFLEYKRADYKMALVYFQNAISLQETCTNHDYLLYDQQLYYAHMYLTNSHLHIAAQTYEKMNNLSGVIRMTVGGAEMSPLYKMLERNDQYLEQHAFYKVTRMGKETCSKEECEDTLEKRFDMLRLYFGDRSIELAYGENRVFLGKNQGDGLRCLLLHTKQSAPATRMSFHNIIDSRDELGEVRRNSFIQMIGRMRGKLTELNKHEDFIISTQYAGETAYYFNEAIPFCIMYRVDE